MLFKVLLALPPLRLVHLGCHRNLKELVGFRHQALQGSLNSFPRTVQRRDAIGQIVTSLLGVVD